MPPPLSGPQPRQPRGGPRTSGGRPRQAGRPRPSPPSSQRAPIQGSGRSRRAPSERSAAAPRSPSGRPPSERSRRSYGRPTSGRSPRAPSAQRPPSGRAPRNPEARRPAESHAARPSERRGSEPDTRRVGAQALAGPVADLRRSHAEDRRRAVDLASKLAPSAEPETRRHGPLSDEEDTRDFVANEEDTRDFVADELDTRDFDTRDFTDVDLPTFPPADEPDTVPHDEDEVAALVEPDTVKSSGEVDDEAPTTWAPPLAPSESGSILSDLPTLTYAPGGPPPEQPKRSELETVRTQSPLSRAQSRPFRWPFLAALGLVVVISGATQVQRSAAEERYRIERVAGEVARIMTASPLPLANERARAKSLRLDLDALRDAGAESESLDEARAGLRSLEGLLALIAGNPREARRALADPDLQRHSRYHAALEASVAACTSQGSPAPLGEVLAGGFVRPELQVWRARARLAQLDISSPIDAEEAIAELRTLASVSALDSGDHVLRLSALASLGRWALAHEELGRIQDPPSELRERVALGELSQVVHGDPGRALAWLSANGLPHASPGALRDLGEYPLKEAHARLRRLRSQTREPAQADQRDLLQRLQLAYHLGWSPLPRQILDDLRSVLQTALTRRRRLPGPCCLALATLGGPAERHEVLVLVARRLEATRTPSGQLPLQALQTTILRTGPGNTPGADSLLAPLPAAARAELRRARITALLELRRPRKALIEAQVALKRHPGDAQLEALRQRAVKDLAN